MNRAKVKWIASIIIEENEIYDRNNVDQEELNDVLVDLGISVRWQNDIDWLNNGRISGVFDVYGVVRVEDSYCEVISEDINEDFIADSFKATDLPVNVMVDFREPDIVEEWECRDYGY